MVEAEVQGKGSLPGGASSHVLGKKRGSREVCSRICSGPRCPPKGLQPSADTTSIHAPRNTRSNSPLLTCPECGSSKLVRASRYYYSNGSSVQRWLCRTCGLRFTDRDQAEPVESVSTKMLKSGPSIVADRQVCATVARGAKNLSAALGEEAAGTSKPDLATVKGKLFEFQWWMQKQGLNEATAKHWAYLLKRLTDLGVNLEDPESVKEALARNPWSDGYRANFVEAYATFLVMEGRKWIPPRYKRPQNLAFIPTETEIDQLIAAANKTTGAFLQGLKDTGADPGELAKIDWTDVDREHRTVRINHPVKGHEARILKVSSQFLDRIFAFPKTSQRVFTRRRMAANFWAQRKRIAIKLQNPRLLQIHFTTFRHWKGTVEYHRTKDILYVKKLLGHKTLQSTLIYIDYEKACFQTPDQEKFFSKVAMNVGEACELIDDGWEYVTGTYDDGGRIFRKRK
jgi:integrase